MRAVVLAAATATAVAFLVSNHRRVRRAKSCLRAIRLHPPPGVVRRPNPLVFLAGTCQKADVWRGRMETLAKAGYECHALDFVQTGRYFTSYDDQLRRLRHYIVNRLDGRPVLIGHSQGGTKAQLYLLADIGDAAAPAECSVRAVALMATAGSSYLGTVPGLGSTLMATAGVLRVAIATLLGLIYLDPWCFCYGGGPWRHELQLYRALFNGSSVRTSQTSVHAVADARVAAPSRSGDAAPASGLPIATWAATYLTDHEPCVTDLGIVQRARSAAEALAADGCELLHLVAANDRIIPRGMSERVASMWAVPMTVVEGQGHQFGDDGWEQSVMGPLMAFLDGLS